MQLGKLYQIKEQIDHMDILKNNIFIHKEVNTLENIND
jgi:hypothetical protein